MSGRFEIVFLGTGSPLPAVGLPQGTAGGAAGSGMATRSWIARSGETSGGAG